MENTSIPRFLHYLVSHHGGKVIAHCLDYDIVAAAADQDEAIERLNFIVRSHVETAHRYKNTVALDQRAPQQYWRWFEQTSGDQILTLDIKGSPIEARFDDASSQTAQLVRCDPEYAVQ